MNVKLILAMYPRPGMSDTNIAIIKELVNVLNLELNFVLHQLRLCIE